jgi:hypothetical protein
MSMQGPISSAPVPSLEVVSFADKEVEENSLRVSNRAYEIALQTSRSPIEVAEAIAAGDNTPIRQAQGLSENLLLAKLESYTTQGMANDPALRRLSDQALKISEHRTARNPSLEGALTLGDERFNPTLARIIINQQIGREVFEAAIQDNDENSSTFGQILDAADRFFIRQMPLGMIEDLFKRSESAGMEFLEAQANMNQEKYTNWIQGKVKEYAAEGFTRKDNIFALYAGLESATNTGYDPQAKWDRLFAVGDAVGILKAVQAGGKLLTRWAAIKGPRAAADAFIKMKKTTNLVDPEIEVEAGARAMDASSPRDAIRPTLPHVDTRLVDEVSKVEKGGTFGRIATPEQVQTVAQGFARTVRDTLDRPLADFDIVELPLGGRQAVFRVGRVSDGSPLPTEGIANKVLQQLTDNGVAAKVEPVDSSNLKLGYYVTARETLDLSKVAQNLDLSVSLGFFRYNIAKSFFSTRSLDDPEMNRLANMGESGFAVLKRVSTPFFKVLNKTSVKSRSKINEVYLKLRDGDDAAQRVAYDRETFEREFKALDSSVDPTDADWDAFLAAKTIGDTAYIIQASTVAKKYIAARYKRVMHQGEMKNAKRVNSVPEDSDIWDETANLPLRKSERNDHGAAIWKTEDGKYFIRPSVVENIEGHHVFGYNIGGNRFNKDANLFIISGEGNGKAFMTAFSNKQANTAVRQLRIIQAAIARTGRRLEDLTDELDDIITENNDWAPSLVTDTESFKNFVSKEGIDITQKIDLKVRGGNTLEADHEIWGGMPDDLFRSANLRRQDKVLMQYGGARATNDSPVKAMVDQLEDVFVRYSHANYTESIVSSWVAKAKQRGYTSTKHTPRAQFDEMYNKMNQEPSYLVEDRSLRDIGAIAQRRMGVKSNIDLSMEKFGSAVRDFTFDNSGLKIPKISITSGLLNMGFHTAFGFTNIGQFWMQASQITSIIAMSPIAGLKASVMALPMRLALHLGHPEGIKRAADGLGITVDETNELFEYIMRTGRQDVANDDVRKGSGLAWNFPAWNGQSTLPSVIQEAKAAAGKITKVASKVSVLPFTEGESLSRITGITTAFLEMKKANPKLSALSDEGFAFITQREHDLTFNMGSASKGAAQKGLGSLPTQWMSYSFRAMEAMVVGRGLSGPERIRLGIMLTLQGGASGVFAGGVVDQLQSAWGLDPNGSVVAGMKYGIYDLIYSSFFSGVSDQDIQTAMGTRLAPLSVFNDIYRKITQDKAYEALGGPSVEIVSKGFIGTVEAVGNLLSGNTASAWEDIERVIRTPSGVDNVWKAIGILNWGMYSSKSGTKLDMPFTTMDALLQLGGITNYKVADYYAHAGVRYRGEKDVRTFTKDLKVDFRTAILRIQRGDHDAGNQLLREIVARVELSGFSPFHQEQIRKSFRVDEKSKINQIILYYIKTGQTASAKALQSLTNDGDQ